MLHSLLNRAAGWLGRTREDRLLLSQKGSQRGKLLLFLILAAFTGLIAARGFSEIAEWDRAAPSLELDAADWKILYPPAGAPAPAPDSPALWRSPIDGTGADYYLRAREYAGRAIWAGAELAPATLRELREGRANQLVLYLISGTYRVWFDGQLQAEGTRADDRPPMVLSLPMERLAENRPLRLAVEFQPRLRGMSTVLLENALHAGWATADQARNLIHQSIHHKVTRRWLYCGASLLLSLLFFAFWAATPGKPEYFYMAAYAMVHAVIQALQLEAIISSIDHEPRQLVERVFKMYEGIFGLFLGLAFARSRRGFFKWGLPVGLLIPWAISLPLLPTLHVPETRDLLKAIQIWLQAATYAAGAGACLLQAGALYSHKFHGSYFPVRVRRLLMFGAALSAMTVIVLIQAFSERIYYNGLAHQLALLGLCLVIGRIIITEYREQGLIVEKTPVSPYHNRPVLPERLSGALLIADLKDSERLSRLSASQGDAGKLVSQCLSHMWTAVLEKDGIILQTEGDQLIAFFDEANGPHPLQAALEATDRMERSLRLLRTKFSAESLDFRAAVTLGEIRPVWQEMGKTRLASWLEAGTSNAFVESARLMELERGVTGAEYRTQVIVPEERVAELLASAPELRQKLTHDRLTRTGKHGVSYTFSVYAPGKALAPGRLAA